MNRAALQTYGTQQVMTSSPVKLIALLYDKAIVSLKEAIQAIEAGEIEKRWKSNGKAIDIIQHLASTLDHEAGGEISANLDRLYNFMLKRLLDVDLKNDTKPAEEVIVLLEPLRESWHQLAEQQPGTAAQPGKAATGATAQDAAETPDSAAVAEALKAINLSA